MQLFKKRSDTTPIIVPLGGIVPKQPITSEQAVGHAEVEAQRATAFLEHRDALQRQKAGDLKLIATLTGRMLPPGGEKIGPDPSHKGMMNFCGLGKEWPSLKREFGVDYKINSSNIAHKEFMIDFEKEIKDSFGCMDDHNEHLQIFGQHVQKFQTAMWNIKDIEESIFDVRKNPHPTNTLGVKKSLNWNEVRLVFRNEMRLVFQHYYNKLADESGAYMRLRFVYKHEVLGGKKTMDQFLVFTFPTSEQEREAYRHVFWGAPYPETSFNDTRESRWLADYHANKGKLDVDANEQLKNRIDFQLKADIRPPAYAVK